MVTFPLAVISPVDPTFVSLVDTTKTSTCHGGQMCLLRAVQRGSQGNKNSPEIQVSRQSYKFHFIVIASCNVIKIN